MLAPARHLGGRLDAAGFEQVDQEEVRCRVVHEVVAQPGGGPGQRHRREIERIDRGSSYQRHRGEHAPQLAAANQQPDSGDQHQPRCDQAGNASAVGQSGNEDGGGQADRDQEGARQLSTKHAINQQADPKGYREQQQRGPDPCQQLGHLARARGTRPCPGGMRVWDGIRARGPVSPGRRPQGPASRAPHHSWQHRRPSPLGLAHNRSGPAPKSRRGELGHRSGNGTCSSTRSRGV